MNQIENIHGLTVDGWGDGRVVKFSGIPCPLVGHREIRCDADTSYLGRVLDDWATYQTPVGLVERHYWATGAGLERQGVDWRIVPVKEIEAAQRRFEAASKEMAAAISTLTLFTISKSIIDKTP